jgi:hypothetical protein
MDLAVGLHLDGGALHARSAHTRATGKAAARPHIQAVRRHFTASPCGLQKPLRLMRDAHIKAPCFAHRTRVERGVTRASLARARAHHGDRAPRLADAQRAFVTVRALQPGGSCGSQEPLESIGYAWIESSAERSRRNGHRGDRVLVRVQHDHGRRRTAAQPSAVVPCHRHLWRGRTGVEGPAPSTPRRPVEPTAPRAEQRRDRETHQERITHCHR